MASCRSPAVAVLFAAVCALGAAPAAALDGWSFGGSTSQRYGGTPFPFAYDDLLGQAQVAMQLRCADGSVRRPVISIDAADLPRGRSGRFVIPLAGGGSRALEVWMTRQRRGSALRGRLRVRWEVRGGGEAERCDSGWVRYTADENTFAGDVSRPADRPIAVSAQLARDGGSLRSLLIAWTTRDCPRAGGGTGFLSAPTRITGVPVGRGGRFRARGSSEVATPGGSTLIVRWRLAGSIRTLRSEGRTRQLLGGVLQVSADLREPDGSYRIRNCATDPLGYVFTAER